MQVTPPITSWSFSRLLEFESCPYRTYLKHVIKSPEPDKDENHPLVRGTRIHSEAEHFVLGDGELTTALQKPKIVEHLELCREAYQEGRAHVEENWGFDNEWGVTDWFGDNIWLRVKLDVGVSMDTDFYQVTDWKTGKSQGKEVRNMQQAQLYAVGVFMRNPDVQFVEPIFAFIDENKVQALKVIKRTDVPRYIQRFEERANKLTSCVDFRAKPNRMNCKYCDFGPNGTRACAHGVE